MCYIARAYDLGGSIPPDKVLEFNFLYNPILVPFFVEIILTCESNHGNIIIIIIFF